MLHHVVTHVNLDTSDLLPLDRSVQAGIDLCRWFAAEARRIYASLSEDDAARDDRRLVESSGARRPHH